MDEKQRYKLTPDRKPIQRLIGRDFTKKENGEILLPPHIQNKKTNYYFLKQLLTMSGEPD